MKNKAQSGTSLWLSIHPAMQGTGRPPSPPQIYQKIICVWNNSHITSEHWQRTPDFQKNKPISESGRAKNKDKKRETKKFGTETCPPGREL